MPKKETQTIPNPVQRSVCPITNTLDVIGDKWTLLIIRDMFFLGKSQFQEFLQSGEGISTNILTSRLKKLEETGLVVKKAYQTNPTRHEYFLTETGETLKPLLIEMVKWGGTYIEGAYTPTEKDIANAAKNVMARKKNT